MATVTVNPAPKTYTIMEGSAKGWTITSTTPPSGYTPSGTTMVYQSAPDIVHWETPEAPEGKAVETTITVTEDKAKGTTTYTGTAVDMGYVSSATAPTGETTQYAPATSQHLVQSDPNLPLTKAEIEQQRGVSFPSDWGLTATPIASTREGTMYSYSFYSISERESEITAKGMIEEARTDIGKNLALSTLIALRRPENVLTALYLAGSRPFTILGASNPEFESWRQQQTTEIVQDIKYYQTHGGIGAYAGATAWESYPTQVMAIPYVGGMAVGKVLNFALPRIFGAIGGAVGTASPRLASAGSKVLGFIESHPTATTLAFLSPVIYGEAKYTYDVGTSSMPTSQKVGLVGTEYLKTGIVLTSLQRGFEEGFVPERKYYLQAKGGQEVPVESKVEKRVLTGKDEFPTDYYRNPRGLIRQFESGKYTGGEKAGLHVTAEGSQFEKNIVVVGKGSSESWGLYTSPSGSIHFARLGSQSYYLNKPPIFKLLPTGDYPAMVQIKPLGGFGRIPTGSRSSLMKGNKWLETKSDMGKQYISPSYEAGMKLEKEAIIPYKGGLSFLVKDTGKAQYNYVMVTNRFGTQIPIQLKYYQQFRTFAPSMDMGNIGVVSGSSSGISYRPSNLVSSLYSPSRYSSESSSSYPRYSSTASSIASSTYKPSYSKTSYSKSSVSKSSYSMSSLSSVSSPYKSSVSMASLSRGGTTRPPTTKLFPDWDMDFVRKGMFKMPKIERGTKYKPSAIGNVLKIKGSQPKTVTGAEFARPISKGSRGWLKKFF